MALTPTKNTALMKPNGNYDQMRIFEKNNKIESQWWSVLSSIAIFSDVCLTVWGVTYTGHSIGRHWIDKEFKNNTNMWEMEATLSIDMKDVNEVPDHYKKIALILWLV